MVKTEMDGRGVIRKAKAKAADTVDLAIMNCVFCECE